MRFSQDMVTSLKTQPYESVLAAPIIMGGKAIVKEWEAEVDKEVHRLLETIEGLSQKDYQKYRDCALSVAVAEESGFIPGMRYTMRLLQECIPEKQDDWLF